MKFRPGWRKGFTIWGGGPKYLNCYLSYYASTSLNQNLHDPRTNPSWRKVCVGGDGGWFEGKLSVSFGPTNLNFGFGIDWDQAEQ